MRFEKGQILVQTEGDYSSYSIRTYLTCLLPFDGEEILEKYIQDKAKREGEVLRPSYQYGQTHIRTVNISAFISWLEQNGYVAEMEGGNIVEWHLSESYLDYYTYARGRELQESNSCDSPGDLNSIAQDLKNEDDDIAPPPPELESFLRKMRHEKRKFLKLAVNPDSHNQGE